MSIMIGLSTTISVDIDIEADFRIYISSLKILATVFSLIIAQDFFRKFKRFVQRKKRQKESCLGWVKYLQVLFDTNNEK